MSQPGSFQAAVSDDIDAMPEHDVMMPGEVMKLMTPQAEPVVVGDGPSGPSPEAVGALRRAQQARSAAKSRLHTLAQEHGVDPGQGSQPSRASNRPEARAGTTVSQATLDGYLRRGQQLFDKYRRELAIESATDEINPVEFVTWALSRKPTLSSNTWRLYRQCILHYLDGFPSYDVGRAVAMLENAPVDRSRTMPAKAPDEGDGDGSEDDDGTKPARGRPARRTSAHKEKRFPIADYDRVQVYLRTFNRSRLAPILADWLRAGILTALRPSEWKATDLEEREDPTALHGRRVYLYVLNAKATNGRGTGAVRTLDLSAFNDAELGVVRRMVGHAREWLEADRFAQVQGQCSSLLYAAVGKIWATRRYHYCLYSPRHQAIANWKSMSLAPAEIAAIVGHGHTSTAAEHYGKRRSGWPAEQVPSLPCSVPEELAVVRDEIRMYQRRLELEVRAGLRRAGDVPEFPLG